MSKKRTWSEEEIEIIKNDLKATILIYGLAIVGICLMIAFLSIQGTWQPYNCVNETETFVIRGFSSCNDSAGNRVTCEDIYNYLALDNPGKERVLRECGCYEQVPTGGQHCQEILVRNVTRVIG